MGLCEADGSRGASTVLKITEVKVRAAFDATSVALITKTLESMPVNSTHWSTRLMAQEQV